MTDMRGLRSAAKTLAYAALYLSGAVHLAYRLNRGSQVVVTYHHVLPDRMLDDSLHAFETHAESVFARQLSIIARRFEITTELGRPHSCVITFDDGYRNNLEIAAPLLAKYGANAYFFVPLEIAQRGETLWVDKLRLWLGAAPPGTYVIAGTRIELGDANSRHAAAGTLWRIVEADYRGRHAIIADMDGAIPFAALPIDAELQRLRYAAIERDGLQALARAGHKIGAHSRGHDILSRLAEAEIEDDFSACAKQIGALYNTRVYAYPFGGATHVDERVVAGCVRAGFSAAFVYLPTLDGSGLRPGPHTLTRLTLPNTTSRFAIEAKLSGVEGMAKALLRSFSARLRAALRAIAPRRYASS
jgi:peptidoglycan/xylan/chitin deacetylase (PgdA/CDA1 family)